MQRTSQISILFILFLALLYSGCNKDDLIVGNQVVATETRQQVLFDELINEGNFNVYFEYDTVSEITIEAESNLIEHIRTIVNGRTLEIDSRESLRTHYPINIYVKSPGLNTLRLSGSGSITADSLAANDLNVVLSGSGNISGAFWARQMGIGISGSGIVHAAVYADNLTSHLSGSGDMNLNGTATNGNLKVSGSGNVNAYDLIQNESAVTISGSGNMYLFVLDYLNVTITGSGSVFYRGNPDIDTHITGSGTIKNY